MNPTDDIVLSGLDQFLPNKAQVYILDKVDEVMQQAVEGKDPDIAGDAMVGLLGVSQASGLAFAKFVYQMYHQWPNFKRAGDFQSYAEDKFGRGKKSINDNKRVWEMLVSHDIDKAYTDLFLNMPIRCLIPIANMWSQGVVVESNQWMKLANAPDPSTINKIIREIKGVEPKAGSIQIEMTDDGTLYAWKNDKRYFVGSLDVQNKDDVVQKAIARLIGDGRVVEK